MKQGEIWLIIVSADSLGKLPLKVIVPVTDWKDKFEVAPWMVRIDSNSKNGLNKVSSADCFQVRSVSQERFVKRIGTISETILEDIKIGLSRVLSIKD